ncbi:hypothetical protein [Maribacter sp. R77961]|uniref:hypothetical protein n=1 Tax=Maribacter sp. R77961 TaxID=3093871 RepID=UPI0037C9480A
MKITPVDSIISISDFKFPEIGNIPENYVMPKKSVLLSYKGSAKRLIDNAERFLLEINEKLDSISRGSSDV